MILVDANLLLYACPPRSVEHDASVKWLERWTNPLIEQ